MQDDRLFAPSTGRNRGPILDVLRRVLPASGMVLEVASGSGEHAAYLATRFPNLVWQPSDPDPAHRRSILAWAKARAPWMPPPLDLDASDEVWPLEKTAAIVAINLIHIAPPAATAGLLRGAGRLLPADGILYLYGAFKIGGRHTAASNESFDAWLRSENPEWGVRDLGDVVRDAAENGLALAETVAMPANNLSVVFRRQGDADGGKT